MMEVDASYTGYLHPKKSSDKEKTGKKSEGDEDRNGKECEEELRLTQGRTTAESINS